MPSQATLKKKTHDERRRVLDAYHAGRNWREVARLNGFKRSTAEYLVSHGRVKDLRRGGAQNVNVTPAIKEVLEGYLNGTDFNVDLSMFTISRHLLDMLYTVKQVSRRHVCYHYVIVNTNEDPVKIKTRIEPTTCNNETNKEKRKQFAEALVEHHRLGNLVIYFNESNYNLYTKRSRGRAKKGKRAIEKLPPTKRANLQIQCAVSSAFGVVAYRTRRGSIKMQDIADFVDELYAAVKDSDVFKHDFTGKKIVVVFDNAPAHSQTETLVTTHDDLVLLRLGPYSPMRNPIENCFSVLKSHIKEYLALMRPEMTQAPTARTATGSLISMTEARMRLLVRAAHVSMPKITHQLVVTMELHSRDFVNAAIRYEDMSYGA
ncbi:Hypothetical protein PHPALM_11668 [Phytophthora palmivora]|uniref:Tc1-like transposase DDE domain-containing protein n=1 Tax=Phytophthora palmivora TaxID=4796 RepID=A0A2P4Y1N2_9STRA|nr:Hypothetical protein PHPALM_11668 [Phytophthora palmivora]